MTRHERWGYRRRVLVKLEKRGVAVRDTSNLHWRISLSVGAPSAVANPDHCLREFCVSQSCTVLRRGPFVAMGAPANRLMQLMSRNL